MERIARSKLQEARDEFVRMMPDIERIAGHVFSDRNPSDREEAVAETVAFCWKNYLQCVAKEKPVCASSLAHYGMLGVRSGRSLCGQSSTDVLALRTQMLGRSGVYQVNTSASPSARCQWDWSEALVDTRVWERPLERVRIRMDYGAFLDQPEVTHQEERVFSMLAQGYGTGEIAHELDVTPPRICQLRHSLGEKLADFMGPSVVPNCHALRGQ